MNETKARASVPSGLRYLARFSLNTVGATGVGWTTRAGFFGEEKKLRMPPLEAGGGAGVGGRCAGVLALNCAIMCGSRRTFKVSVNSSLLCSMLPERVRGPMQMTSVIPPGLTVRILALFGSPSLVYIRA